METERPDRDEPKSLVDLAAVAGIVGIVFGVMLLGESELGFDRGAIVSILLAWIPVTLPTILVVFAVTALDLAAGIVVARLARGRPFAKLGEAILQGFVISVARNALLLGILGGIGLFSQPILLGLNVVVLAAAIVRRLRILDPAGLPSIPLITPFRILLLIAWAAPILLILASPVVPFTDVLPNHVAPAEHLRVFGTMTHLTDTQSPIYGPSRSFLGYTALLGAIATASGIPAAAAVAAFVLPSLLVVAIAIRRLAIAVGGNRIGDWALLAFAMTASFAHLSDARATVIVLPLVAWVLATVADQVNGSADDDALRLPAWLLPGLGVGGAILLHPVIGILTVMAVGFVVVARPARTAARLLPALVTGAVIGLPQALTMIGVTLPTALLAVALVAAPLAGFLLARSSRLQDGLVALARLALAGCALGAIVFAGPLVRAAVAGSAPLPSVLELSLIAALAGVVLRAPAARNPVPWAALAAGLVVATLAQLVPEKGSGMLGTALRFELPKTLQYWVPVFVAVLAAGGLAAVLQSRRIPTLLGGLAVIAFVGTAAMPVRSQPIDAFHLGEHRFSETLSIDLRWAARGFWRGYPDPRYIVDQPRREILNAVRAEIAAGRIRADTPVLHLAGSFQQWKATPLGLFTGVTETDVSPDAEVSIHTVGGRLHPLEDLAGMLAGRSYPYLLLEPDAEHLPADLADRIAAVGYTPIFQNRQGTLFRLGA